MWNGNGEPPADFLAELYGEVDEEELLEMDDGMCEEDVGASDDEDLEPSCMPQPPSPPPMRSPTRSPRSGSPARSPRSRSRSPVAPAYSPLTSPERRVAQPVQVAEHIDSRFPSSGLIILGMYDEDGVRLDEGIEEQQLQQEQQEEIEIGMAPDAHDVYLSDEMHVDDGNAIGANREIGDRGAVEVNIARDRNVRSVRGRPRGVRRGRASGHGRPGRGRGGGRNRRQGGAEWVVGHPLEEIWMTDDDVPPELVQMAMNVVRTRQTRMQVGMAVNRSTRARDDIEEENSSESEADDVFEDAIDGRGNAVDHENPHFEWSPMETFQGKEEVFKPAHTGAVATYTCAYDAFRSYWDDSILEHIVAETNRYATKIQSARFQSEWYPTNVHEIMCLFAFWMMLSIIKMPTILSCFSLHNLLKTEIFRTITTWSRYINLVRALHFVDADPAVDAYPTNSGDANYDRLHRLRPIITHLNAKFQANYVLSKDICIDESLTLWKGRLNFKQYIRSKAAKFGIKTFELCESATGYLWSFLVYTGKHNSFELPQNPLVLKSTAVVKKLIGPLLNKGYRLFLDNWYNSPLLARFLKRNGTDCVGTLRTSRSDVPYVVTKAPLKQGQLIARHCGDICVLSWQDKKRITMISTCHGSAIGLPTVASHLPTRPLPFKPQVVLDYNKYMGGVDLKDQLLEPYLLERKRCAKWYMKLFKRLLNCSILNARVLLQSSMQHPVDHLQFRLQLVDAILTNHLSLSPLTRTQAATVSRRSAHPARILHHTHWPEHLQTNPTDLAHNRNTRRQCVVCKTRSTFRCRTCDVALCIVKCFETYHTT